MLAQIRAVGQPVSSPLGPWESEMLEKRRVVGGDVVVVSSGPIALDARCARGKLEV
jgi:hypothetical protein